MASEHSIGEARTYTTKVHKVLRTFFWPNLKIDFFFPKKTTSCWQKKSLVVVWWLRFPWPSTYIGAAFWCVGLGKIIRTSKRAPELQIQISRCTPGPSSELRPPSSENLGPKFWEVWNGSNPMCFWVFCRTGTSSQNSGPKLLRSVGQTSQTFGPGFWGLCH